MELWKVKATRCTRGADAALRRVSRCLTRSLVPKMEGRSEMHDCGSKPAGLERRCAGCAVVRRVSESRGEDGSVAKVCRVLELRSRGGLGDTTPASFNTPRSVLLVWQTNTNLGVCPLVL